MYYVQVLSRDAREEFNRVWLKGMTGKENDHFVYTTAMS